MRPALALAFALAGTWPVRAQQGSFKDLRYDEQYAVLADDTVHHTLYARLKMASVRKAFISTGGEGRAQCYKIEHEDWGETPESTDGYVLSRFLLHLNVNFSRRVRLFTQLQGGMAAGKKSVSPVDNNRLDLHQTFVDYRLVATDSLKLLTVRAGRQELLYGSQRLVSVREGPNYRQSFDGAKLMFRRQTLAVDVFYTHHVNVKRGVFNDAPSGMIRFWGLYTARPVHATLNIDLYYLGYARRKAVFQAVRGHEQRHSFGLRLWHIASRFNYDAEAVLQTGSIAGKTIFAATGSLAVSFTLANTFLKPELGLKTEAISGDAHAGDNTLGTFNAMFPRGGYFGLAALFGPQNIMDVHPFVTLSLSHTLAATLEYNAFWRQALADGLYTSTGRMIYAGAPRHARFIGDQVSCGFSFAPNVFVACALELKWFHTGPFLKEVGTGKDILFGMAQVQVKF